jgi:hypothetical protein
MPKRERPKNLLGDLFETAFAAHQKANGVADPVPYFRQKHDYIQLARLLNIADKVHWQITPERFAVALSHYFSSELPCYPSLGHLAARFSAYYRSPLNQYGQPLDRPIASNGRNGQAVRMMERRYAEHAQGGDRNPGPESQHRKRLPDGG